MRWQCSPSTTQLVRVQLERSMLRNAHLPYRTDIIFHHAVILLSDPSLSHSPPFHTPSTDDPSPAGQPVLHTPTPPLSRPRRFSTQRGSLIVVSYRPGTQILWSLIQLTFPPPRCLSRGWKPMGRWRRALHEHRRHRLLQRTIVFGVRQRRAC